MQDLRDTHGNEGFALRIVFPNKDYKPNAHDEEEKDFQVSQEKVRLTETN